MIIREAIDILNLKVGQNVFQTDPKAFKALKLSIEALKYVYFQNDPDHQMYRHQLPGETFHTSLSTLPSDPFGKALVKENYP